MLGWERGSTSRAVGLALTALAGCSGTTPAGDVPAPDLSLISVFYPFEGRVHGRGLPGAVPAIASHVRIRAHPALSETFAAVAEDGSFHFGINAPSGDVLELAASLDAKGTRVGEPAFVLIPESPLPPVRYVCCVELGTCQQREDAEAARPCPDPATGSPLCDIDADCGVVEGEYLELDPARVRVTAPNEKGRIAVTGVVTPNVLMVVQNRGLSALGQPGRSGAQAQITSDRGAFAFDLAARGDDELVIQLHDLHGYRSPRVAFYVPDAQLAGLDVIGAYPWEALTPGARGKVAIQLSPFGIDGLGICPDTTEKPEVCFSGGLTHGMVSLENVRIDMTAATPVATATSSDLPYNRGLEGDVRGPARDVVLVMDASAEAHQEDGNGLAPPRRLGYAATFLQGLRQRDRVGAVIYGGDRPVRLTAVWDERTRRYADPGLRAFGERPGLAQALRAVTSESAVGVPDPFEGIAEAARLLRDVGSNRGRIVLVLARTPSHMDVEERFQAAYELVRRNDSTSFNGYTVDVVGFALEAGRGSTFLGDLASFTRGQMLSTNLEGLEQTLVDLGSLMSGNFILLYDMLIPANAGKSARITFDVEVVLGGAHRARASYSGPLRILNAPNN